MSNQILKLNRATQFDFFSGLASSEACNQPSVNDYSGRVFISPDPESIYLGSTALRQHLQQAQQTTPFIVADILNSQDWSSFEARYASSGRPPYAPRNMTGLILYGIMQGITSLRGLEQLARLNLGCMWVSGGIYPDHANIGRFINLHSESLTGDFFEALAATVLKKTGSTGQRLAGDGTTIEAACSNYNLVKEEAAKSALEEARRQAKKEPENPKLQEQATHTEEVYNTLIDRKAKRKKHGQNSEKTMVSPTEPEAILQKMKRGRGYAPGYTPSILANEKRVVLAHDVDPTSEITVIPGMLDQTARVTGTKPEEMLLDGGYFNDAVISTSLERDISLLCPESGKPGCPKSAKKFQKGHFRYDQTNDVYICPAKQTLRLLYKPKDPTRHEAARVYGDAPCEHCPLKAQCTTNIRQGRRIKRFASDDAKDTLREVMQHPTAKKVFRQRKAMVEPVFGYLRTVQGLNRFRRRGLSAVKVEFGLHLLAYNLSRAVATSFSAILMCIYVLVRILMAYRQNQRFLDSWLPGQLKSDNPNLLC